MKSTVNELKFLITQGEGYNLEFKEQFSNRIALDICAFANANGGRIISGVKDDGTIAGIKITNQLKSQIYDLARNLDPSININLYELINTLIINVPEGKKKPYSTKGKFYIRYGANSQQLKREDIRQFFQEEGLVLFDEQPNLDFDMKSDFNESNFKTFLEKTGISPVQKNNVISENLRLLKDGYLKNAGVLLFCKKVTDFFLHATLTCVLYRGETKYKILDRKEYDGDIYSNYENAIIYLQSKLNTEFIIKSGPREEKLELPEEALREAVLNAIAHRDYFVSGANILVEIYSDRIEITNPGGL
jgi:ATP-dependent DNA helicase RecG